MLITCQNRNAAAYERLFDALIQDTFGFSFAPWFAAGLWDERYESFSIIEDGVMLANLCLFRCQLRFGERPVTAYQLGAVATRKEHRGKGLSRRLVAHIDQRYPDAPMFLFANPSVLDFYPRFGFRRVYESCPSAVLTVHNPDAPAHRLAPGDPLVWRYLTNNRPASRALHAANLETVEFFHLLLEYSEDIYHMPELDVLVVAAAQAGELFLPYLNKPEGVSFAEVAARLPFTHIHAVRFGFMPDRLDLPCAWTRLESGDEAMFVRGALPLPEPFAFPALAKT